jgi:hypothetical protein
MAGRRGRSGVSTGRAQAAQASGDASEVPAVSNLRGRGRSLVPRGRGRGRSDASGGGSEHIVGKGRNFFDEEERQLTRSVLAISQDPICGNQQKSNAFWDRIFVHYDERRPGGYRPPRSLESKWGLIKHDIAKFIGVLKQVASLKRSGTSKEDLLIMAKELYRTKSPKNVVFQFEHCWLLVKDYPRWAEGWSLSSTPSKRKTTSSEHESNEIGVESESVVEGTTNSEDNHALKVRPGGTRAAKEVQKAGKQREGAMYAQAAASEVMAQATMRKAAMLEDHNILMLMTLPESRGSIPEAQEYLRLRQAEVLKKLKIRLADDGEREAQEALQLDRQAQEQRATAATQAREALETRRQIEEQGLQDQVDPSDDVDDDQEYDDDYMYDGPDADGHDDEFNTQDREIDVAGEQVASAQNRFGHAGTWFGAVGDQMGAAGMDMGVAGVGMRVPGVGRGVGVGMGVAGMGDRMGTRVAQFGYRTAPLQSRGTGIRARYNGSGADVFQMSKHNAVDISSNSEWAGLEYVDPTMNTTWNVLDNRSHIREDDHEDTVILETEEQNVNTGLTLNGRYY